MFGGESTHARWHRQCLLCLLNAPIPSDDELHAASSLWGPQAQVLAPDRNLVGLVWAACSGHGRGSSANLDVLFQSH